MPASSPSLETELSRLYQRTAAGVIPGLDVITRLLRELGDPHRACPVIHVAGTNGKGSVCAMVESILRSLGLRTGMYTSPHLVRFNERIQICGIPVSDNVLASLIAAVDEADHKQQDATAGRPATFFECSTAMAFKHFADAGVDVAVIETGLGGIWDATNVVEPEVSVITPVSMDHMEFLGHTLSDVAREKAGIIKPGRPVVTAVQDDEAAQVLEAQAGKQGSTLVRADQAAVIQGSRMTLQGQQFTLETANATYGRLRLPLLGRHQAENAVLAVLAAELFTQGQSMDCHPSQFKQGLEQVVWPGRLQIMASDPLEVLDGAHNPAGARKLQQALSALVGKKPVALVFSVLKGKEAGDMLASWESCVEAAWAVPLEKHRALGEKELLAVMRQAGLTPRSTSLPAALQEARAWAREKDGCICVTGSLYLVGEYLSLHEHDKP